MKEPIREQRHFTDRPARTPALKRTVTLKTDFAQRVYRRTWDHLKADIFTLTVRARTLEMEKAAETSEKFIMEQFDKVRKDFQGELERLDTVMESQAIGTRPEYPALSANAEFTSPQANEYLKLLELMDEVLIRIDTLWLHGVIEAKQRVTRSYECQRRMIKIANRLRNLGGSGRTAMYKELQERQTARGSASVKPGDPSSEPPSNQEESAAPVEIGEFDEETLDLMASADADTRVDLATTTDELPPEKPNGRGRSRARTAPPVVS